MPLFNIPKQIRKGTSASGLILMKKSLIILSSQMWQSKANLLILNRHFQISFINQQFRQILPVKSFRVMYRNGVLICRSGKYMEYLQQETKLTVCFQFLQPKDFMANPIRN